MHAYSRILIWANFDSLEFAYISYHLEPLNSVKFNYGKFAMWKKQNLISDENFLQ